MDKDRFERLVEDAVRRIPGRFRKLLKNISIIVEDRPGREVYQRTGTPPGHMILGLYHGVPYGRRGAEYGNVPPDVISIYQEPIETVCRTEEEIRARIEEVLIHEIGHYFGFDDPYLHQVEKERRRIESESKKRKN